MIYCSPCCGTVIIQCACVCYLRDVYRFICFIVAMYVHHLGLYCVLFRRVLIYKIDVALQLTKLSLKKLLLHHSTYSINTSLWNIVPKSELKKFTTASRSRCLQLQSSSSRSRWSSLLTTPTRQSTSRDGCLLQVYQL